MKVIIAVAQYNVSEKVADSIAKLNEVAKNAACKGAVLLIVPETVIGLLGDIKKANIDYLPQLQKISKKNQITVAASFYTKERGRYFNQGYIVAPSGKVLHSHRKIYLASPEREKDGISGGNELTVSQTDVGKVGMLICKDGFNRFSHFLYERLNELGAEIVCIPTWSLGWDKMDVQEYIRALYIYGAFASRAYVLVSGNLNKETKSFGRSLVVSPTRGVLQEGSTDREELIIEEIDLDEVKKARDFDAWWQPKERIV